MNRFYIIRVLLISSLLHFRSAFAISSSNDVPSRITKRALVSETMCDDGQDNVIGNPIFHAALFANTTIDMKLSDGTAFHQSKA
jgi:hypothetical protein